MEFVDIVSSGAEYIDFVKFGWGTAVVTGNIDAKIDVLRQHHIGFYFGGTLFEKFVLQDRLDDFRKFCAGHRCRHVEVSNGTISLTNSEKASYIRKLADDFTVISEVGFKDPPRSEQLPAASGSTTSARTSTPAPRWSPWRPGRAGGPASAIPTARCGPG